MDRKKNPPKYQAEAERLINTLRGKDAAATEAVLAAHDYDILKKIPPGTRSDSLYRELITDLQEEISGAAYAQVLERRVPLEAPKEAKKRGSGKGSQYDGRKSYLGYEFEVVPISHLKWAGKPIPKGGIPKRDIRYGIKVYKQGLSPKAITDARLDALSDFHVAYSTKKQAHAETMKRIDDVVRAYGLDVKDIKKRMPAHAVIRELEKGTTQARVTREIESDRRKLKSMLKGAARSKVSARRREASGIGEKGYRIPRDIEREVIPFSEDMTKSENISMINDKISRLSDELDLEQTRRGPRDYTQWMDDLRKQITILKSGKERIKKTGSPFSEKKRTKKATGSGLAEEVSRLGRVGAGRGRQDIFSGYGYETGDDDDLKKNPRPRLTKKQRDKLKSNQFGIPRKREFPMPDLAHVRAARRDAETGLRSIEAGKKTKFTKAEYKRVLKKAEAFMDSFVDAATKVKKNPIAITGRLRARDDFKEAARMYSFHYKLYEKTRKSKHPDWDELLDAYDSAWVASMYAHAMNDDANEQKYRGVIAEMRRDIVSALLSGLKKCGKEIFERQFVAPKEKPGRKPGREDNPTYLFGVKNLKQALNESKRMYSFHLNRICPEGKFENCFKTGDFKDVLFDETMNAYDSLWSIAMYSHMLNDSKTADKYRPFRRNWRKGLVEVLHNASSCKTGRRAAPAKKKKATKKRAAAEKKAAPEKKATKATAKNPPTKVHRTRGHKYLKKSESTWERYCATGKEKDLLETYKCLALAHEELKNGNDKAAMKQAKQGLKAVEEELEERLD